MKFFDTSQLIPVSIPCGRNPGSWGNFKSGYEDLISAFAVSEGLAVVVFVLAAATGIVRSFR